MNQVHEAVDHGLGAGSPVQREAVRAELAGRALGCSGARLKWTGKERSARDAHLGCPASAWSQRFGGYQRRREVVVDAGARRGGEEA